MMLSWKRVIIQSYHFSKQNYSSYIVRWIRYQIMAIVETLFPKTI